jgi:hypothetical protein
MSSTRNEGVSHAVIPARRKTDADGGAEQEEVYFIKLSSALLEELVDPENRDRIQLQLNNTRGQVHLHALHLVVRDDRVAICVFSFLSLYLCFLACLFTLSVNVCAHP